MMDWKQLLEDDDEVENREIQHFYEENLSLLRRYSLGEIPSHVLKKMAVKLHVTLELAHDWRSIVEKMGVRDNEILDEIQVLSPLYHDLPIVMALRGPLQENRNFGQIIQSLIDLGRFDALRVLKDFCMGIISGDSSLLMRNESCYSFVYNHPKENFAVENANSCICLNTKEAKLSLDHEAVLTNSSDVERKTQDPSTLVSRFPNCQRLPIISVFIPHTESDREMANRLSEKLLEYDIKVWLLSEIDHWLMLNRIRVINAILQEIDFVVPLVSESYLQQITPPASSVINQETEDNCYIFNQISKEYSKHGCINYRIRPVIVPEIQRESLEPHTMLQNSALRLWGEVEKLVKVLKRTKPVVDRIRSGL